MLRLVQWGTRSHETALRNARAAATELSRARVERQEVEHFLADLEERRDAALRRA